MSGKRDSRDVCLKEWLARQEELRKPGGVYERFAAVLQLNEQRLDSVDPTWRSRVDWDNLPPRRRGLAGR